MQIKASFVCPTYNGAAYLAETIESIRRQTVKEWELVVVDDASTDSTIKLLEWYGKEDSRIIWTRHDHNLGTVAARNTGNAVAKGKHILVIDHDDLCARNRLDITMKHFEKHPDTDIFHGGWYECNIYGTGMEQWEPMKLTKARFDTGQILFCHSTCAYPKRVAEQYPYRLVEGRTDDHVALDDWLTAGLQFRTTKRPLAGIRRLPQGQMQKIRASKGLPPSWRIT